MPLKTNTNTNTLKMDEIIQSISQPVFDLDSYCELILDDEHIRDEIVHLMINHPHIMVYYHCFYIVEKASYQKPAQFYGYWSEFAALLNHANSYHRDFGLVLIATLTLADGENRIVGIMDEYLQHASDKKYMTAQFCLQNCRRIIQAKPELRNPIISSLLMQEERSPYSVKQKALLRCCILEIIQQVCMNSSPDEQFKQYVLESLKSESPKTRKMAKELAGKFNLLPV